jgi:hypothetical protein
MMKRFRMARFVLVSSLATLPLAGATHVQARPLTATVTVLHALPGFTADVYVNGKLTLSGFKPETATDPIALPPGRYAIDIRDVGAKPTSKPVLSGAVTLEAGQNLSIIAGLTEQGDPELNVFRNALARVPPGHTRLIVRNVSDASSIGIDLDGKQVFGRVPHGDERKTLLKSGGPFPLDATVSGDVAISSKHLTLEEGTAGIVYAVGSSQHGTLTFMYQTIRGLQSSPGSVLTGDGGFATPPGFPAWAIAVMSLAGLCFATASVVSVRRLRKAADPRVG